MFDAKAFLANVSTLPGVYWMLGERDVILYVGKAKNLKNRLSSYFRQSGLAVKTQALMAQVVNVQITITRNEVEALLLESNLIKAHKPRYNVLLRDDKSYPNIFISPHVYPQLAFDRGKQRGQGEYFGPYPSTVAVRDTLNLLQKVFQIRPCEDNFFNNRSRPCLQYQIKRCTAPCVAFISPGDYQRDVDSARLFLQGKNQAVIDRLIAQMDVAAEKLDYEHAARLRDQVQQLRRVHEQQYISGEKGDLDIVAVAVENGLSCVQVFFIRHGRNLGNKSFFPSTPANATAEEIAQAFISQYYSQGQRVPAEIIVNVEISERDLLEVALQEVMQSKQRIIITHRVRGERLRWLNMAQANADNALKARLRSRQGMTERLEDLTEALSLETPPTRMECFDISHTQGEATVGACVVFDSNGPLKTDYRRFNIEGITPGDDYAAMRQALERRYTRLKRGEGRLPDILFIDGGKGQVAEAVAVLTELQVEGVLIVGIAKGAERIPGQEKLILPTLARTLLLSPERPGFHLIQQIRDEAHRFAIAGHRARRGQARQRSVLEDIPGLGPKRRQQLLKAFGGWQGVKQAGIEELAKVQGISPKLAEAIYNSLHTDES
ncbi:MAG: excinuclease ABC subunit UvrC [Gammaproteobacteria bacterium]|nr:excinuclease ABC subunit UvrC [Gammaproteobacteria bacterium]